MTQQENTVTSTLFLFYTWYVHVVACRQDPMNNPCFRFVPKLRQELAIIYLTARTPDTAPACNVIQYNHDVIILSTQWRHSYLLTGRGKLQARARYTWFRTRQEPAWSRLLRWKRHRENRPPWNPPTSRCNPPQTEQVYVIDKGPHPLTKHHFKSVVSAVQVQGSPACVVPGDS